MNAMRETIRDLKLRRQTQLSLQDIARQLNPLLRGWIGYYGRYAPSALYPLLRYVNHTLVAWAMRKFKRFKTTKFSQAGSSNGSLRPSPISSSIGEPVWSVCLPDGSRVRREFHARFCERPGCDPSAYSTTLPHLQKSFNVEVQGLRLCDSRFYHLETCFCPLEGGYLLYYPAAFDAQANAVIEARVPSDKRFAITEKDAVHGNAR